MINIRILPESIPQGLLAQKGFKPDILRTEQAGQILREGFGTWSPFFALTPPEQLAQWDVEHTFGKNQVTVVALDGENIAGRATIAEYNHPVLAENISNSKGAYGLLDAVLPQYRKYGIWTAMMNARLEIMETSYPENNLIYYSDYEHEFLRISLFNIASRRGWEAHPSLAPLYVREAYNFETELIEFNLEKQDWVALILQQEHRKGYRENEMVAHWNGLVYAQPKENKAELDSQQEIFKNLSPAGKSLFIAEQIQINSKAGEFNGKTWEPRSVTLLTPRQVHRAGIMRRV